MSRRHHISRRSLIQGAAAAAGLSTVAGSSLFNRAFAQAIPEKPVLLVIHLGTFGGYNSVFNSADSFTAAGDFGAAAGNITNLGNGLVVDTATLGSMPDFAKTHMASIGMRHEQFQHEAAQRAVWGDGTNNFGIRLASVMGGDAAIKCALMGDTTPGDFPKSPVGGVSLQQIRDMGPTIAALGGGAVDPLTPNRDIAAGGLTAAQQMSGDSITKNPVLLGTVKEGYATSIETLKKPVRTFNLAALQSAYGIGTSTTVNGFGSKMAAAELMVEAGANVIIATDGGDWDTHDDNNGARARRSMARIMPSINTFVGRTSAFADRNVVTVIMAEFNRSIPNSNHNSGMTATVVGKYVKTGTTGKTSAAANLPPSAPKPVAFWSYLATVLKSPTNPFGANPHNLVL